MPDFIQLMIDLNRTLDLEDHFRHPLKRPELTEINEPSTKQPDLGLKATGVSATWQSTRY